MAIFRSILNAANIIPKIIDSPKGIVLSLKTAFFRKFYGVGQVYGIR